MEMKKFNNKSIFPLIIMGFVLIIINGCKKDDSNNSSNTVTDADGNVYHTITVKSQTWMVENLKTTQYNDGSGSIPNITDNAVWGTKTSSAFCWYNNDLNNKATYGALYNWYAVNSGKLCPAGWHVPSDDEWSILITNLGDTTSAGGKLKEAGTSHWITPNTGADNSSGFTALPGGSHYTNGSFYLNGKYGWYWSSTESSSTAAWHEYMIYNSSAIMRTDGSKSIGFSVRCIKNK
jgi:uncharacterized protein (TIGR02145 family)